MDYSPEGRIRRGFDDEHSVGSNESTDRVGTLPVLPSVRGAANVRIIVEKLAAIPGAWRVGSPSARDGRRKTGHDQGDSEAESLLAGHDHYSQLCSVKLQNGGASTLEALEETQQRGRPLSAALGVHTELPVPVSHRISSQKPAKSLRSSGDISEHGSEGYSDLEGDWIDAEWDEEAIDLDSDAVGRFFTKQWTRLRDRRDALKNTFASIRKEQVAVHDFRQRRNQAYEKLKMAIQPLLPGNLELAALFADAQTLDFKSQEAETCVDELIDDLHDGELDLEFEERKIYSRFLKDDWSTDTSLSRSPSRETLRGIGGDRPENFHPKFRELRNAVQEVKLAQEDQASLSSAYEALSNMEPSFLTSADMAFMEAYDGKYSDIQESIQRWTDTARRLETMCRDKNLIPHHSLAQYDNFGYLGTTTDDIYLEGEELSAHTLQVDDPAPVVHPDYSLLLSNFKHLLRKPFPQTAEDYLRMACNLPHTDPKRNVLIDEAKKEFGIETLLASSTAGDKYGYINRWLLHRLRQSSVEVGVLLTTFALFLKVLNFVQLQRDVLFHWSRDAAAKKQPAKPPGEADDHQYIASNAVQTSASARSRYTI
ncbi:hypothetical protein BX600DRAFT_501753 [Xylariales sp. PMI_506]|nr:hypothetical protein BX600DRAFT_501753 [Xylariales sp. PMI_506]